MLEEKMSSKNYPGFFCVEFLEELKRSKIGVSEEHCRFSLGKGELHFEMNRGFETLTVRLLDIRTKENEEGYHTKPSRMVCFVTVRNQFTTNEKRLSTPRFFIEKTATALARDVVGWITSQPESITMIHYKGGVYKLIDKAYDEETLEEKAVYSSIETGKTWVRSWDKLFDKITKDDGSLVRRFRQAGINELC